jgi:hypothetical protein
MEQWEGADLLSALRQGSQRAERQLRRYVAGREIIRAFSETIRVDFASLLTAVEADLRDSVAEYNTHAERSKRTAVRSEKLADLPPEMQGDLHLERIELEELGPPAEALAELKGRLAGDLRQDWEEAAREILRSSELMDAPTLSETPASY